MILRMVGLLIYPWRRFVQCALLVVAGKAIIVSTLCVQAWIPHSTCFFIMKEAVEDYWILLTSFSRY